MSDVPFEVIGLEQTPDNETAHEQLVYRRTDRETDKTYSFPVGGVNPEVYSFADDDDLPERIDFDFVYVTGTEMSGYRMGAETWRDDGTVLVLSEPRYSGDLELNNYAGHSASQEYIWERPFAESRVLDMLLRNGVTGTAALDFLAISVLHRPRSEWEELRGVSQQAISDNYVRASEKLGPNSDYWTRG
jgi:hypothetical protein